MKTLIGLGKYLFALPFAVFGILHFMNAEGMASMAFGSAILVYITGACLIAATISILIGKKDGLATILLAVFLLATALLVQLKGLLGGDEMAMGQILKDLALAGAALLYSGNAKEKVGGA